MTRIRRIVLIVAGSSALLLGSELVAHAGRGV